MSLTTEKRNDALSKSSNELSENLDFSKNEELIFKAIVRGGSFLFVGQDIKQIEEVVFELTNWLYCSARNDGSLKAGYCKTCSDCQLVQLRQHPDLYWLELKGVSSTIKIEDIRLLKERINLKPFQSTRKVFVLKDATRLSIEAANALLKTLEEPPQNAIIILIAQNITQLLPTVVSRCQLVRFISKGVNQPGDDEEIKEFIRRFLDTLDVSGGAEDNEFLNNIGLYEEISTLQRVRVEQLLYELASVFRDMTMIQLEAAQVQLISSQSKEQLIEWAQIFPKGSTVSILEEIIRTKNHINKNANIKLSIDLLIKLINKNKLKK